VLTMDEYILELMNNPTVNRIADEAGNRYGIRVLGRGENLFFQENDKALICQIDAVNGVIFTKSIKNWEGQRRMDANEKSRVITLLEKYYKQVYNPDVKLNDGAY
jgi:hypothetical protein